MKKITYWSLLLLIFILSGCVIRMIPYEVNRVDQELKGNRGIVRGKVPEKQYPSQAEKTRTMYNIEIELYSPIEGKKIENKVAPPVVYPEGNRGYIYRQKPEIRKEHIIRLKGGGVPAAPQVVYKELPVPGKRYKEEKGRGTLTGAKSAPRTYVVEEGDTLQKISQKIYGTTKKWKKIYEANRDVLKHPDMIRPGQKLVIPER